MSRTMVCVNWSAVQKKEGHRPNVSVLLLLPPGKYILTLHVSCGHIIIMI
jgi:hypothetical protein